nr:MAG TPA: hypothetical protein [Caudoviricetes sp.]
MFPKEVLRKYNPYKILSAFFCYHSNIASPIRCFNNSFTLPLLYRQYKSGNFFGLASDFNFHLFHLPSFKCGMTVAWLL